jgi:hypothetical protein
MACSGPVEWLAAALLLAFGLLLILTGRGLRRQLGLGDGRTVSLDRITLTSYRLGLTGRPDRIIKTADTIVVEDWKSGRVLRAHHRAQLGVYCLLIEDQLGVRPAYGVIVCGDGTRHRVENDEQLRAWVLELAGRIRAAREKRKKEREERKERKKGRVGVGVASHPSHRSGRARLRHPARPVTRSLRHVRPRRTALPAGDTAPAAG